MQHKPGKEHDLWKEAKDKKRAERGEFNFKKKDKPDSTPTGSVPSNPNAGRNDETSKALKLSEKMKAVLMSRMNCTEEDASSLVSDMCQPCLNP